MYQHLFVVLNPHENEQEALKRATQLTETSNIRLTVFASIYDYSYDLVTMLSPDERENMRHSLLRDLESWVNSTLQKMNKELQDVSVETLVMWHPRPFEAIIHESYQRHCDLIIKASKQHHSLQSIVFTPTDWHLLRKAPCPVLLVKNGQWMHDGHIVAAIHAGSENAEHQSLNQQIVQQASYLARQHQAELHYVTCYPTVPRAAYLEMPSFNVDAYRKGMYEYHHRKLTGLLEEHSLPSFESHLLEGLPEEEIPKFIEQTHAGLLVLGTVGRSGLTAALLGNTAEHIIERIQCDLLALKPINFHSPLFSKEES